MIRLLGRGPAQERRCLGCRIRKKRCVFNGRDAVCQDCGKFWIECMGVGEPRPLPSCEKEIVKSTKEWIKGKKNVDRTQPPLSLTSIIHNVTRAHPQPRVRESPGPPARQDASTSANPPPLIAPEPYPNSDVADPSIVFPEPPPQNPPFVWDMQQLTLAPMIYNLHNPRGFIKDQDESPVSPIRIMLESADGENDRFLDVPGFPQPNTMYENLSFAGSGSSFNDQTNTTATASSEFIFDFEGHGIEYSHGASGR